MQKTLIELMAEIFQSGRVLVLKDSPRRWNAANELKEAGLIEVKAVDGFKDAMIVSQFIPEVIRTAIRAEAVNLSQDLQNAPEVETEEQPNEEPAPL